MIKTQFSSLSFLRSWKLRFLYFVLLPVINMILLVTIDMSASNKFDWQVASSAILISGALQSMSSMSGLLIGDLTRGIDREMVVKNPFSIFYWFSKIIVSVISGGILVIINMLLLWLIGGNQVTVGMIIVLLIPILLIGTILGFTGFVMSWRMNDPYFATNLISTIAYLVSGTLVSMDLYPEWLKVISKFFPFSNLIHALRTGNLNSVWIDIGVAGIWLFIGIALYLYQRTKVLDNKRYSML